MMKLKNKNTKKPSIVTFKVTKAPTNSFLKLIKGKKSKQSAFPIWTVYQGNSIYDERPSFLEKNSN